MVEHREGQTQPHGSTVEHSAEEPQATREELSSDMTPTDGQPSLDTSTTRTSGYSSRRFSDRARGELKVPRGTEKMRASKEAFAEHLTVGSAHALPETQTTMPFTSGALDSLASPTGRAGGDSKHPVDGASMGQRRGKMKMCHLDNQRRCMLGIYRSHR